MYTFTFSNSRGEDIGVVTKNILVIVTCIIFLVFFSNVMAGAAGIGVFLSDVGEMLTLFAACISFVMAMLGHERSAKSTNARPTSDKT
jgi:hypothetical protein